MYSHFRKMACSRSVQLFKGASHKRIVGGSNPAAADFPSPCDIVLPVRNAFFGLRDKIKTTNIRATISAAAPKKLLSDVAYIVGGGEYHAPPPTMHSWSKGLPDQCTIGGGHGTFFFSLVPVLCNVSFESYPPSVSQRPQRLFRGKRSGPFY